jgi:hypothetical protein
MPRMRLARLETCLLVGDHEGEGARSAVLTFGAVAWARSTESL